jgi:hypothetical protein
MSNSEDCICNSNSKRMEYFKIDGSRIELRWGNCNGLVNWLVEHPRPVKQRWSKQECEAMR